MLQNTNIRKVFKVFYSFFVEIRKLLDYTTLCSSKKRTLWLCFFEIYQNFIGVDLLKWKNFLS